MRLREDLEETNLNVDDKEYSILKAKLLQWVLLKNGSSSDMNYGYGGRPQHYGDMNHGYGGRYGPLDDRNRWYGSSKNGFGDMNNVDGGRNQNKQDSNQNKQD